MVRGLIVLECALVFVFSGLTMAQPQLSMPYKVVSGKAPPRALEEYAKHLAAWCRASNLTCKDLEIKGAREWKLTAADRANGIKAKTVVFGTYIRRSGRGDWDGGDLCLLVIDGGANIETKGIFTGLTGGEKYYLKRCLAEE